MSTMASLPRIKTQTLITQQPELDPNIFFYIASSIMM